MKINVFGAGAIGGFLAAALSRAGHEIGVVARGEHLQAIRGSGHIRISQSDLGPFEARVHAAPDLRDLQPAQYVLLTFKSHQWDGALEQLQPSIAAGAALVTLQNGLPFWLDERRAIEAVDPGGTLLRNIPRSSVIGGVVHASGHIVFPGVIHQSGGMLYPLGELDGTDSGRVVRLSEAFTGAGMQAPVQPEIRKNVWLKVINNAALNPVSALTRARMHAMLADRAVRGLLAAIITEGIGVARATGIELGVTAEQRLEWAGRLADVKTSMLQDLEAGKRLELEPICGAVVEVAQQHGVRVPVLQNVYALTKLLQQVNLA